MDNIENYEELKRIMEEAEPLSVYLFANFLVGYFHKSIDDRMLEYAKATLPPKQEKN